MPTYETVAEGLSHIDLDVIRDLQKLCYFGSRSKGFHEESDRLRAPFNEGEWDQGDAAALRNFYGNKLMLIVGEVSEAHEQLREGRAPTETYYPTYSETDGTDQNGTLHKPEGIPSELADVVIRVFDFAGDTGIDLAGIIGEKLLYNASRAHKHGKKF